MVFKGDVTHCTKQPFSFGVSTSQRILMIARNEVLIIISARELSGTVIRIDHITTLD